MILLLLFMEVRRRWRVSNVPRSRLKLHLWIPPDDFTPSSSHKTSNLSTASSPRIPRKNARYLESLSRYLAFFIDCEQYMLRKQGKGWPYAEL